MKAVLFKGTLEVVDLPKPERADNECLIRLLKGGICNTDIEVTRGYMGYTGVLGHEFVGVVEESSNPFWIGKRVVGEINASCGHCEYCRKSQKRHCPYRTVLGISKRDGIFREYFTLPEENLHRVVGAITTDDAVFVEPLAAACEILDQIKLRPTDRVAILGDGKLGLLIAMVLAQHPCELALVGKHPENMELVRPLGVEPVDAASLPAVSRAYDVVIDATGSPLGWEQALRLTRPLGTLVLKSTFYGKVSFNPASIVLNEITIVGSRCGRFEAALRLLLEKKVKPSILLQRTFPLDSAVEAFQRAQQPGALKIALEP